LARLKLHLLQRVDSAGRLALLGHAPMSADEREARLRESLGVIGVPPDALGPARVWAEEGPDHAGRYEYVFAQLRAELQPYAAEVEQLLSLRDLVEQARRAAPTTPLGQALDEAFDRAMDLPILIRLFG